jgi:predicted acyl esterase
VGALLWPRRNRHPRPIFEHFLKGADNGWDTLPAVRLETYETAAKPVSVAQEDAWPPSDLTWTDLNFDLDGRQLSVERRSPRRSSASFATRGDGLSLEWTIPHDMDIVGPMSVRVLIQSPDLDDVHLFAGVREISGGTETTFEGSFGFNRAMVSTGWQRAAFRELDDTLSTPHQPVHTFLRKQLLTPREIVPVDIEMRPHATRFRAGDVLRLDIRGTWHYPTDPIRGQFPAGYQPSKAGTFVVHSEGARLHLGWRGVTG